MNSDLSTLHTQYYQNRLISAKQKHFTPCVILTHMVLADDLTFQCMQQTRDDHYPVCRVDIPPDSKFSTGYGYPKRVFLREQDPDKDIRFDLPYSIF